MSEIAGLYEVALRKKLRFKSLRGPLTLEQLWDTPLRSRDGFDLDVIAKDANKAVKEFSEESFVQRRKNSEQTQAEVRLELVKHVIDVKIEAEERAEGRAENIKKREKLRDALEKKQDSKLEDMTEAQIKKQLGKLDADEDDS